MPLSNYFEIPKFRAVDDDATSDTQALTSALEAQLACSHDWLHANGGGKVARIQCAKLLSSVGYGDTVHVAATWASLMAQPFLVTRGLSAIRVTMLGTVEDFDVSLRLELVGFKSQDSAWGIGTTSTTNVIRQIILTLDQPADVEYETDLVLWAKSRITGGFATTANSAIINEGIVEIKSATISTDGRRTLATVSPSRTLLGFPTLVIHEALFRTPTGVGVGGSTGMAVLAERNGGAVNMGEVAISRITTRSFFVEAISK